MTTQDQGPNERGPQFLLPANDPREPGIPDDQATERPFEVPVIEADFDAEDWGTSSKCSKHSGG